MIKKKLFLVKREVFAASLGKALTGKGKVYEIQLAEEKFQPETPKKNLGFNKK